MEALRVVDLADKAKNKANDLSGGQKQRVCIARAIVNEPKVIFADEPTGNLDSGTGDRIIKLLFGLNQRKGITLIIVTHDQDLANMCDRQIHIADGNVVGEGVSQEVYDENFDGDNNNDGMRTHNTIKRIDVEKE